jgi:hypothetical protein
MCEVFMDISVEKIDRCVESVWRHLYSRCQTDVWSLYGHFCTRVIRLMCEVCMNTSVHKTSDWCVESLWTHLYTSCQTDVWSLYSDMCTPDIRLIYGLCMEAFVHKNIRLMFGVFMKTLLHQLSHWCIDSVWTHHYINCHTEVWSLYSDTFTQDIRLMCGDLMEINLNKISDLCVKSVRRYL